jgi:hypothetical protein
VSVLLGLTLFGEALRSSTVDVVVTGAALAVALVGVILLARAQPEPGAADG